MSIDQQFGTSRNERGERGNAAPNRSGRVPPHNLQAEESVLGALLLSRDAIGVVGEAGLKVRDFYSPAHQHIFDSIRSLYSSSGPVDVVTVADELRRHGLLDEVGGIARLNDLQNATPSVSGAEHYARIVMDTALLRRLIHTAGEITDLAFSEPDDVTKAVDLAESKMFEVAEDRVVDSTRPIQELLNIAMDQLEENYERGDTITGAATGYDDLDELLSGLQPSTLNIVGARPAMGKCVAWYTPMVDLETGDLITADELMRRATERGSLCVQAIGDDGRSTVANVDVCLDDGVKDVFTLRTRSGREVTVTAAHPFLTAHGWRRLDQIVVGDEVAAPSTVGMFGSEVLPDAEIDLLALVLGDGCVAPGKTSATFTTELDEVRQAAADAARALGTGLRLAGAAGNARTYRFSSGYRGGLANPVMELLRTHGMWGKGAHDKQVPEAVFRCSKPVVARFLSRLFATDGTAWVATAGYARIGYSSVSKELVDGVAHLLRRFGLRVKLRERRITYQGGRRTAYEIEIMDAASLLTFCDEIGILGKSVAVGAVRQRAEGALRNERAPDYVPAAVWDDIEKAKGELSWAEINRLTGRPSTHNWHQSRRGKLRRSTVAELADALDDERLRWWSSPDVIWEAVTSIEPAGQERVIDFTVPRLHNFVAADFYLHNTAFGLGMATHIAKHSAKPVLVFSLEMGHSELTQRILSSEAKVDSTKLRTGKLSESDWSKIGLAVGRLEVPLFLDDNPQVTVMEIRAKARRIKAQHGGLALIMIDYLQLMSGSGNSENRQLEVSEISRNLKVLARELEVPIVALSQLSRNLEARSDKRPMLADLRESGSLEQDADVVMFLYRDEVYNPESPDKGSAEVIVSKHRSGPIGTKRLVFLGQYTRFDNAARSM
jgi:replicative DNA helicase